MAFRLPLLLNGQTCLLLLQPAGVVSLIGITVPSIHFEDPAGDVVEEIAIMRDRHDGPRKLMQKVLQPGDRFGIEMVRRFVKQQQVGILQQDAAQPNCRFSPPER